MAIIIIISSVIILYFFAVWPRLSMAGQIKQYNHVRFAHRGYHCATLGIPENSMSAIEAALLRGYGIELDIHLTKDGRLAVFHDNTLKRMCGCPGRIEDYTWQELARLHLLDTHERIPLFTDVLACVNGRVPLLIELKIPGNALAVCEAAYEVLKNYTGPYLVQSFHTLGIRWFRLHAPEVLRGQLSNNLTAGKTGQPWILRFLVKHLLTNFLGRPDFISYKLSDLPSPNVSLLRTLLGVPVAVWTLRTEEALEEGIRRYDIQIFEKQEENY